MTVRVTAHGCVRVLSSSGTTSPCSGRGSGAGRRETRRAREAGRRLRLLALCLALLACETAAPPVTPYPPKAEGVCAQLAYAFFLVAEKRDRGSTREDQIETARESVDNPFARHPDETLAFLLRMVDFVYRRPEASAEQIQAQVMEGCAVDQRGQAVLLWPAR
jgi:hypothetical protein